MDSNTQNHIFSKAAKVNPFLKRKIGDVKKNPLELTEITRDINLQSTSAEISLQKIEDKKSNTEITSDIESNKSPNESFVNWLQKEKSNLESTYPNLSPQELTQIALKMYKKNNEKRKALEEAAGFKGKQIKLSAYAFSKKK